MKVSQVNDVVVASDTGNIASVVRDEVNFTANKDGSFTGLVPVKLPSRGVSGETLVITTSVPVVISSETTPNSKGRQRMMVKVSLPYKAVNPNAGLAGNEASLFDSSRSGGEITVHQVISVPKSVAEDFRGVRGSLCQRTAIAQILFATRLLAAVQGSMAGGPTGLVDDGAAGSGVKGDLPKVEIGATPITGEPMIDGERAPKINIATINGYSVKGFDLSALTGLESLLDNPVVRGLNGLTPIPDEKEILMPSIVGLK